MLMILNTSNLTMTIHVNVNGRLKKPTNVLCWQQLLDAMVNDEVKLQLGD